MCAMSVSSRIKEVASRKKEEIATGIEKEKEYRAYKHPDLSYVTTGKSTTDYKYAKEFAERKEKEEARAAERKERARLANEARRKMLKKKARAAGGAVKQKLEVAMKEQPRQGKPDPFGFGGGSMRGFDPVGFGKGEQIDVFWTKRRGRQKEIKLW